MLNGSSLRDIRLEGGFFYCTGGILTSSYNKDGYLTILGDELWGDIYLVNNSSGSVVLGDSNSTPIIHGSVTIGGNHPLTINNAELDGDVTVTNNNGATINGGSMNSLTISPTDEDAQVNIDTNASINGDITITNGNVVARHDGEAATLATNSETGSINISGGTVNSVNVAEGQTGTITGGTIRSLNAEAGSSIAVHDGTIKSASGDGINAEEMYPAKSGTTYGTIPDLVNAPKTSVTVTKDTSVNGELVVKPVTTFDLNGTNVTSDYLVSFGKVVDDNITGTTTGVLKIAKENLLLASGDNGGYLPVYDDAEGVSGYRFVKIKPSSYGALIANPTAENKADNDDGTGTIRAPYTLTYFTKPVANYKELAPILNRGYSSTGVHFVVNITFEGGETEIQPIERTFSDATIKQYMTKSSMPSITITNLNKLTAGTKVKFTMTMKSGLISILLDTKEYTVPDFTAAEG
jgi:hypothetical protein